jgi:hypothetical protein
MKAETHRRIKLVAGSRIKVILLSVVLVNGTSFMWYSCD